LSGSQIKPPALPEVPDFLGLLSSCKGVLTDSGGIQEETTFLSIPCLTLRENTECPVTVEAGSNKIVGLDKAKILACLSDIIANRWKKSSSPPLWDGRAAERVVKVLRNSAGAA
jgi:UDP-N-acetylglucosamine 2-epimerase (non-hydrolysing)